MRVRLLISCAVVAVLALGARPPARLMGLPPRSRFAARRSLSPANCSLGFTPCLWRAPYYTFETLTQMLGYKLIYK